MAAVYVDFLSQVIQRQTDGTENFYRPWDHDKTEFGNVASEYWLGEFLTNDEYCFTSL